jgi:hypothetical protein
MGVAVSNLKKMQQVFFCIKGKYNLELVYGENEGNAGSWRPYMQLPKLFSM